MDYSIRKYIVFCHYGQITCFSNNHINNRKKVVDEMTNPLIQKLEDALLDWEMMTKTSGDEGADNAERFEMHFYEFIDELKVWFQSLKQPPTTVEEAENLDEIKDILERLPVPLELNFYNELELIIEGKDQVRYD